MLRCNKKKLAKGKKDKKLKGQNEKQGKKDDQIIENAAADGESGVKTKQTRRVKKGGKGKNFRNWR